ncbi:hypothetical protein HGM15179_019081, partial [Zosterops borbonicus]
MPLSPAGSKHENPESPPPEPPGQRQPRSGEPSPGLREEPRLEPARSSSAGPRSPKLPKLPPRMEEPAPGAIVVRIGIPDLQQT